MDTRHWSVNRSNYFVSPSLECRNVKVTTESFSEKKLFQKLVVKNLTKWRCEIKKIKTILRKEIILDNEHNTPFPKNIFYSKFLRLINTLLSSSFLNKRYGWKWHLFHHLQYKNCVYCQFFKILFKILI